MLQKSFYTPLIFRLDMLPTGQDLAMNLGWYLTQAQVFSTWITTSRKSWDMTTCACLIQVYHTSNCSVNCMKFLQTNMSVVCSRQSIKLIKKEIKYKNKAQWSAFSCHVCTQCCRQSSFTLMIPGIHVKWKWKTERKCLLSFSVILILETTLSFCRITNEWLEFR